MFLLNKTCIAELFMSPEVSCSLICLSLFLLLWGCFEMLRDEKGMSYSQFFKFLGGIIVSPSNIRLLFQSGKSPVDKPEELLRRPDFKAKEKKSRKNKKNFFSFGSANPSFKDSIKGKPLSSGAVPGPSKGPSPLKPKVPQKGEDKTKKSLFSGFGSKSGKKDKSSSPLSSSALKKPESSVDPKPKKSGSFSFKFSKDKKSPLDAPSKPLNFDWNLKPKSDAKPNTDKEKKAS